MMVPAWHDVPNALALDMSPSLEQSGDEWHSVQNCKCCNEAPCNKGRALCLHSCCTPCPICFNGSTTTVAFLAKIESSVSTLSLSSSMRACDGFSLMLRPCKCGLQMSWSLSDFLRNVENF